MITWSCCTVFTDGLEHPDCSMEVIVELSDLGEVLNEVADDDEDVEEHPIRKVRR